MAFYGMRTSAAGYEQRAVIDYIILYYIILDRKRTPIRELVKHAHDVAEHIVVRA